MDPGCVFAMYINDLPNTSKLLSVHLFADDTNVYCSRKKLNDLELILNQELHAVAEWMKSKKLARSILKANFVLFHSKKLKPYKSLNLKIDGVNIQEVSSVKYLGVSNLTWKNHVNELCLKLSKIVGIFSKLRYYVNIDILIILYYSQIYPLLSYGIQVWGLTFPTYLKPGTTLQKRVVRIMTFSDPISHSEPLLKSLRLLKFSDMIHLEILSFVYQWCHKLSLSCFVNYFNPVSSIHSYNTHQSLMIICLSNLFIPLNTAFVLSVTLVQNFGILYLSKIKPFSSFCQYIKNSVIDGYNTIIDS